MLQKGDMMKICEEAVPSGVLSLSCSEVTWYLNQVGRAGRTNEQMKREIVDRVSGGPVAIHYQLWETAISKLGTLM